MGHSIRLTNAALRQIGDIKIISGALDPASLRALKVDVYQRELLPRTPKQNLVPAIKKGVTPDIVLGMRGNRFTKRDGDIGLHDDVYIIDGQQRTAAARDILSAGETPYLGAIVHLGTTFEWERNLFWDLDTSSIKLSSNVLMRNLRWDNHFMQMMFDLCGDEAFTLRGKVAWNQHQRRGELITALSFVRSAAHLHAHFATGLQVADGRKLANNMLSLVNRLGLQIVRSNVEAYWQSVDEIFNIRDVKMKAKAPYLHQNFNLALADIYARHQDFWKDNELKIAVDVKRKLATFSLREPYMSKLCSGTKAERAELYSKMVEHVNSGRRIGRLTLAPLPQPDEPAPKDEIEIKENTDAPPLKSSTVTAHEREVQTKGATR